MVAFPAWWAAGLAVPAVIIKAVSSNRGKVKKTEDLVDRCVLELRQRLACLHFPYIFLHHFISLSVV
jgi:hypothetical protein